MKFCKDCDKEISNRGNRATRCVFCQNKRNKVLMNTYNAKRLGSPKLYTKKHDGRLVPATYGCGININHQYPIKKAKWMNFDSVNVTDAEQEQRNKSSINDNTINDIYNVTQSKRPRKKIYRGWRY